MKKICLHILLSFVFFSHALFGAGKKRKTMVPSTTQGAIPAMVMRTQQLYNAKNLNFFEKEWKGSDNKIQKQAQQIEVLQREINNLKCRIVQTNIELISLEIAMLQEK